MTSISRPIVFLGASWRSWRRLASNSPLRAIGGLLLALAVVVVLFAPALPIAARERARLTDVFLLCIIYSIIALGLNVVVGYTGLLDLGVVAFASIGAYTATILYDRPVMQFPGSFVVVLLIGGLHAAAWGCVRGAPTLRLSGDYYAIVTFAFAEIVRIVIRNEGWLTGGGNGFKNYPVVNLWGAKLVDGSYDGLLKSGGYWQYPHGANWHGMSWEFYYLCLAVLLVTIGVMRRLESSRIGRAWFAIKADETSAAASGVNVAALKMNSFAISAFFAGIGGALLSFKINTVSTNVLDFWFSVIVLCGLVLGGMGSVRGAVVGTFLVYGLGELLREELRVGTISFKVDDRARFLLFGALLVLAMVFRPGGILSKRRQDSSSSVGEPPAGDIGHLHGDVT